MSARRELILYATPEGELGRQCRRYFEVAAAEIGPTTAQTYPPHVTLTGFFRRADPRADEVVAEMLEVVRDHGPPPPDSIEAEHHRADDWVGLAVRSPWLEGVTARVVAGHRLEPGDDALRPKSWLHLSLAYGRLPDGTTLDRYRHLASDLVDPAAPGPWAVSLWERRDDGSWVDHGASRSPGTG